MKTATVENKRLQTDVVRQTAGCLGFMIPLAGAAHHAYLWRLYQGLAPLERKLITRSCMPGGWASADDSDVLLLSSRSLLWRGANKCWRGGCGLAGRMAGHSMEVPSVPLGWRSRLREFIGRFEISGLMITYGGFGVSLLDELERLDVPVAMVFGGSDAQISDNNQWYGRKIRQLWERVDQCIFISQFLKNQAIARGCSPQKSRVIYRGCVIGQIPERIKKPYVRIVSVGNLGEVKGFEYLIKSFAIVSRMHKNIRLSIIGRGVLENQLRRLAAELGLSDEVEFMGGLSWEAVQAELGQSDIYVQPSIRTADGLEEGFCQAVLEAQVMQLPAIVFDSGALVETIEDGVTGFVVPERDCGAMAELIGVLIGDANLRWRIGAEGRKRAKEKFEINAQNAIWRNAVEELMAIGN